MNITLHDCINCDHHCFECDDHENPDNTIYCGLDGEHGIYVDEWGDVMVIECNKNCLEEI